MIEIYLDGARLEVPQDISIGLNMGIADYADPITASGAYTQTVEIPRTPHNDKIMHFAGEVGAQMFNHAEHTATILEDGCELVEGRAFLEGVSLTSYNMQVVGEEIGWVENIRDKELSEIEGESIGAYRPDDWGELVNIPPEGLPKLSFVLMQHGHWYQEADDKPMRRLWVTYNDLIPIVKLHTLLEHCFAGYKIVGNDRLLNDLHRTFATMAWKAYEKANALQEDMGFELSSKLLYANEDGELKATLTGGDKAVLSVFDTIEEDKNGVLATGSDDDGISIEFTPSREVIMALEMRTRYRTSTAFSTTTIIDNYGTWNDVAISDPSFADQLYAYGNDNPFVQFRVEDSIEWGEKTLLEAKDKIRDEAQGIESEDYYTQVANMPLCVVEIDNPELYESIGYVFLYQKVTTSGTLGGTTVHSTYRPTHIGIGQKQIVRANQSIGPNLPGNSRLIGMYIALRGKDGLIYVYNRPQPYYHNGYVYYGDAEAVGVKVYSLSDDQHLTFDVALKTPRRLYEPGRAYIVNRLLLGSSTYPDKEISVYGTADGSLKPSFEWGVPIGGSVKLSDVGGDILAEDMLRSIMQLYNLVIYTNPKTKEVHLYPFSDFWRNNIVDWSNRIDHDSDISISAMGDEIGKSITLRYADGNARIKYYDERHELPYFAYKKGLATKVATEEKEVQNTLFSPAYMVDVADEFGGGSGKIPAVAEKDKEGNVLDFNLADVPHTVLLISNEITPPALPLDTTVFGDIGGIMPPMTDIVPLDITLSFADRENTEGLHQHYDKQIALWDKAKRLTCHCRVEAWEIEALRHNADNINFRSLFKLNINGEDIYGRLESIEYEPTNTTNKCIFIIE